MPSTSVFGGHPSLHQKSSTPPHPAPPRPTRLVSLACSFSYAQSKNTKWKSAEKEQVTSFQSVQRAWLLPVGLPAQCPRWAARLPSVHWGCGRISVGHHLTWHEQGSVVHQYRRAKEQQQVLPVNDKAALYRGRRKGRKQRVSDSALSRASGTHGGLCTCASGTGTSRTPTVVLPSGCSHWDFKATLSVWACWTGAAVSCSSAQQACSFPI